MKNPRSLEPFLAIRTEREYDAAVARLNALVEDVGDDDKDPRYRDPNIERAYRGV